MIKKLKLISLMSVVLCLTACASLKPNKASDDTEALILATAIPVLESITRELIQGTKLSLEYLPPERYSIKRIPGWLKRQNANSFPNADVLLTINSVWPAINLYPALRSQNISIIPTDAAYALVPGGERVAITPHQHESPDYFWLNLSNALMMTGIIHRDLVSIVSQQNNFDPIEGGKLIRSLKKNHQHLSQKLRSTQTRINEILFNTDYMQALTHSRDLEPLLSTTLLPSSNMTEASTNDLPTLFITNKKVGHKSTKTLPPHFRVWHIDDFGKPKDEPFSKRWENNLITLQKLSERKAL